MHMFSAGVGIGAGVKDFRGIFIFSTQEAVQDLAKTPEDPDTQAAFRQRLKKLLTENKALTNDLGRLVKEAKAAGITIMALGERSVAAQEITGRTIITGDQNVVKSRPER